jgi:CRP-like cAMP-binding protein
MHREWIFRMGRFDAEARVAHLFCETHARLVPVGLVKEDGFDWPLTQQDLAEATGLTSVHVNRTLRSLREAGALKVAGRRATIGDLALLQRIGQFDPGYLYLGNEPQTP